MAKGLISMEIAETATIFMRISYYGWRFHYIDLLVLRCPGSYNFPHRLSRCGNPGMSPPPSSKGGLSPNDGSGFFSSIRPLPPDVQAKAAFDPSPDAGSNRGNGARYEPILPHRGVSSRFPRETLISLTAPADFLYNSGFSAFMPAEKTRESLHSAQSATNPSRKKQGQQSLFLDRS
ncbi:hypothetical protein [Burkholderia gladioli]|uniref:hypothetical protein n=1 Tax=Burkholderia gladioli TaxID=28095 RepID=UPI00163E0F45|nr:hypothetical protein [Burkholderia gladioli]MDC6127064.1 hypothetical protein [Burkholderia gladioli]